MLVHSLESIRADTSLVEVVVVVEEEVVVVVEGVEEEGEVPLVAYSNLEHMMVDKMALALALALASASASVVGEEVASSFVASSLVTYSMMEHTMVGTSALLEMVDYSMQVGKLDNMLLDILVDTEEELLQGMVQLP